MVKPDLHRDYYGDLECKPTVELSEIKKQYRKLALKYHPDRNPGKELEFISKFQAIQAAHDVLVDPQLRAKYDADRIRAGMLHTYASPSRPAMPPRKPATHFPPPPTRPPPHSTTKTNFPPPPSGNRYPNYSRPENTWAGASAEDAQAKANDFKAWEQMRHGQGPVPGRTVPPKAPKPSAFTTGREAGNGMPKDSMPKRSGWDQFQESHPAMSRAKSTRAPRNAGFDPGSPGGDEPQARHASAYFNISSRERTQGSRASAHFPTPPSRTGNPPKKPDASHTFKGSAGPENPFAKSARISTPYATAGGEKTYLSSQGLGRSSSWREGRRESEWYDGEPNNAEHVRPRATSARSNRKHSASPHMTNGSDQRPVSSSSSSSSSDESIRMADDGKPYASATPLRNDRPTMDSQRRPRFKPSVKVEDVDDEDRYYPGQGDGSSNEARKRQAADRNLGSNYPEGFAQHRTKREGERSQHPSLQNSASKAYTPPNQDSPQRPLNRPRSWHHSNGSAEGLGGSRSHARPAAGDQNGKAPMYDPFGNSPSSFTPSSKKWSDQWPFNSPKKPRTSTAVPPPYWAIPSSLAPLKKPESQEKLHKYFYSNIISQPVAPNHADSELHISFTYPETDTWNKFKVIPPLRSHSSETINMNFSPSEWHGKFTASTNEYFEPPASARSAVRGRTSPTKNRVLNRKPPLYKMAPASNGQDVQDESTNMPPPPKKPTPPPAPPAPAPPAASKLPPLPAETDYSSEEWAQHFKPATFTYPPPPLRSPVRHLSRKRPMAPRKFLRATYKRPTAPKPTSVSAALGDAGEDPELASVSESLSSKNSDGSAMDIDPASTPPSAGHSQGNGEAKSPPKPNHAESTPRPTIPPTSTDNAPADEQDPHLGLGDLKDVAPFAPSHEGLKNLNELSSTLPFESRPSNNAVNLPSREPLALPNPPKAPQVPANLTQTSWERYIAQMRGYMFEWNAYNTKMLNHFNNRQALVENTLRPEWMSAVGDGTEKWGFKAYMQDVEEDFRVREHWDVSWEKHRECMKALGGVRERLIGSSVHV